MTRCYILLLALTLCTVPAFAQNQGFSPLDSMRRGWDLAEQAQEPDARYRQQFPGSFYGAPPPPPQYPYPPRNIGPSFEEMQFQNYLNQQFREQVDRETGQGRYQRRY